MDTTSVDAGVWDLWFHLVSEAVLVSACGPTVDCWVTFVLHSDWTEIVHSTDTVIARRIVSLHTLQTTRREALIGVIARFLDQTHEDLSHHDEVLTTEAEPLGSVGASPSAADLGGTTTTIPNDTGGPSGDLGLGNDRAADPVCSDRFCPAD